MPKQCNHMLKTKAAEPPRRCKLVAIEGSVKCSVHKGKTQNHTQGKGKEGNKASKTQAEKREKQEKQEKQRKPKTKQAK